MFQDFTDDTTDKSVLAARLAQLRRQLKQQKLDGFLVPREDAFQGEYVPAANERLKYITGFGGSAGMAVVLAKKPPCLSMAAMNCKRRSRPTPRCFQLSRLCACRHRNGWRRK